MIALLKQIVDTITATLNFLWHTIQSLATFILHIPQYSLFISNAVNVLPDVVLPFALASISVSIMLFIINRQKG